MAQKQSERQNLNTAVDFYLYKPNPTSRGSLSSRPEEKAVDKEKPAR